MTELVDGQKESREDASHPADDGRLAETFTVEFKDGVAASTGRRFRTPDTAPPTKRRGPKDDLVDSKFRCTTNYPDVFYMAAGDSVQDIDIDYTNEVIQDKKKQDDIEKRILASRILGVDVTEVYSPARVNEVAERWGRKPGLCMDLTNGNDFTKLVSFLQELSISVNNNKNGWMDEFCCTLYKYQIQQGRHCLHEHPWTARSWQLPYVIELLEHASVGIY